MTKLARETDLLGFQSFVFKWVNLCRYFEVKKPIECSAPKYVDYLLEWVELQVDDEALFPQAQGAPFPKNFPDVVRKIFTRWGGAR